MRQPGDRRPSGRDEDLAVPLGVGEVVERRADPIEADLAGDQRVDVDLALGQGAQRIAELVGV